MKKYIYTLILLFVFTETLFAGNTLYSTFDLLQEPRITDIEAKVNDLNETKINTINDSIALVADSTIILKSKIDSLSDTVEELSDSVDTLSVSLGQYVKKTDKVASDSITNLSFIKITGDTVSKTYVNENLTVKLNISDSSQFLFKTDTIYADSISGIITDTAEWSNILNRPILTIDTYFNSADVVYVDKNRLDLYPENGTFIKPYKTIQSAINYIASLNQSRYFIIEIKSGIYAENVVLENAGLRYIKLQGNGYVSINPTAGNALQSTINNENLFALYLENIYFAKPIIITGSTSANSFNDMNWNNLSFASDASITLTTMNNFALKNSYSEGTITLNNVNWTYLESSQLQGNLTMNMSDAITIPSWGKDGGLLANGVNLSGQAIYQITGTATYTPGIVSCRWGKNANTAIPTGTTIYYYNSWGRGNHINAGQVHLRNSYVETYTSNGGSINLINNPGSQIYYDNTSYGEQHTVQSAIEELYQNIGIDTNSADNRYLSINADTYIADWNKIDNIPTLVYDSSSFALSETVNDSFGLKLNISDSFSGSYDDLRDKPFIPDTVPYLLIADSIVITKISELQNDSNFISYNDTLFFQVINTDTIYADTSITADTQMDIINDTACFIIYGDSYAVDLIDYDFSYKINISGYWCESSQLVYLDEVNNRIIFKSDINTFNPKTIKFVIKRSAK